VSVSYLTDPTSNWPDLKGSGHETRRVAKPGSGLPDSVTRAGFYSTCSSANAKRCNKPVWTEDALGNRTEFTYEQATGLPLTITAAANSAAP